MFGFGVLLLLHLSKCLKFSLVRPHNMQVGQLIQRPQHSQITTIPPAGNNFRQVARTDARPRQHQSAGRLIQRPQHSQITTFARIDSRHQQSAVGRMIQRSQTTTTTIASNAGVTIAPTFSVGVGAENQERLFGNDQTAGLLLA